MKVVLRFGGSVLGSPPNAKLVEEYATVLSSLTAEGHSIAVVVGGGQISRKFIESARDLGLSSFQQDTIAIFASRLNARLVAMKFGGVSSVPTSVEAMLQRLSRNRMSVMGGLKPGITTDAVAALVAERWRADLMIKCSDQDGIFTADPRVNRRAKKLDRISYERMQQILGGEHKPGIHSIVDPVAVEQLMKSRVKLVVLNGAKPKGVLKAVHGQVIGTVVS
ncbi:MAG: UMP kinase [Nitrososphaerales archaeon]|nr:UMP kinase [Nitrososphaerales archaeon]